VSKLSPFIEADMTDWIDAAREADHFVHGFRFADGGELDLRLHYRTLGVLAPDRSNAVLMLHGTTGGGKQFLRPETADFLFAKGQPLDSSKYFIILPDDIGRGGSSKLPGSVDSRRLPLSHDAGAGTFVDWSLTLHFRHIRVGTEI
jgi:homoserine acetyltransferase